MQRKTIKRAPARAPRTKPLALEILPPSEPPPRIGPADPGYNSPMCARLLDALTSDERKMYPITTGFLDYFPDAVADVSRVSFLGNAKHNPGQPLHWSRGKSADHADCIARHLDQRGGFDVIVVDGKEHLVRHSAALAWRAMALLQEELEYEKGYELPRGASTT